MRRDPNIPMTVREAANALGLSVHTIRAWVAQRKLTYVRLGRAIRVLPSAVEDMLRNSTVQADSKSSQMADSERDRHQRT